jgi:hypothetical protein
VGDPELVEPGVQGAVLTPDLVLEVVAARARVQRPWLAVAGAQLQQLQPSKVGGQVERVVLAPARQIGGA